MNNFIITFGQQHTHHSISGKTLDRNTVAVIKAVDHSTAHDLAMEWFDRKFHECYPEAEFDKKGLIEYYPKGKVYIN